MAELFGDWAKGQAICNTMAARVKLAGYKAMLQEAQALRKEIVTGIREGAPGGEKFKPLAKTTLAVRLGTGFKGTKPLIHRGDLRNSVIVKIIDKATCFVGILRTATGEDGKPVVNVAKIHEEGSGPIVVPITAKSSAYYHAMLRKAGMPDVKGTSAHGGGRSFAIIRIPARPFMEPVFRKFCKPEDVKKRFYERLVSAMSGDFGQL